MNTKVALFKRALFRPTLTLSITSAIVLAVLSAFPAAASATTRPGYGFETAHLLGETPLGFHVYVDPRQRDHARLASFSKSISQELRSKAKLPVTYSGYGTPTPADGRILVNEGNAGCSTSSEGNTLAVTFVTFGNLANGYKDVAHSTITVCPSAGRLSNTTLLTALRHEFGHAMGLSHTTYNFKGHGQIMYPGVRSSVRDYEAGDLAGLRLLASRAGSVRAETPPVGMLNSEFSNGTIKFTATAAQELVPGTAVRVMVTDNGKVLLSGTANAPSSNRPVKGDHGFSGSTPWPGGKHVYCLRVMSPLLKSLVVSQGCVTWSS